MKRNKETMKGRKRRTIGAAALILAMAITAAGCGGAGGKQQAAGTPASTATSVASTAETVESTIPTATPEVTESTAQAEPEATTTPAAESTAPAQEAPVQAPAGTTATPAPAESTTPAPAENTAPAPAGTGEGQAAPAAQTGSNTGNAGTTASPNTSTSIVVDELAPDILSAVGLSEQAVMKGIMDYAESAGLYIDHARVISAGDNGSGYTITYAVNGGTLKAVHTGGGNFNYSFTAGETAVVEAPFELVEIPEELYNLLDMESVRLALLRHHPGAQAAAFGEEYRLYRANDAAEGPYERATFSVHYDDGTGVNCTYDITTGALTFG